MLDNYRDVLTISEVADALRIDRRTVMRLLSQGDIAYRKIGRIYRISKAAVIAYIDNEQTGVNTKNDEKINKT